MRVLLASALSLAAVARASDYYNDLSERDLDGLDELYARDLDARDLEYDDLYARDAEADFGELYARDAEPEYDYYGSLYARDAEPEPEWDDDFEGLVAREAEADPEVENEFFDWITKRSAEAEPEAFAEPEADADFADAELTARWAEPLDFDDDFSALYVREPRKGSKGSKGSKAKSATPNQNPQQSSSSPSIGDFLGSNSGDNSGPVKPTNNWVAGGGTSLFNNENGGSVFNTPGPKRRSLDLDYLYRRESKIDKDAQKAIAYTNYLTDRPGRRIGLQDLGAIDKLISRRDYPQRRDGTTVTSISSSSSWWPLGLGSSTSSKQVFKNGKKVVDEKKSGNGATGGIPWFNPNL